MIKKELLSEMQLKAELCEMMVAVDNYLRSNDIRYSVARGTMLGAIRHNGFIPWDDDIDIGILRKDYNKLLLKLQNNRTICNGLYASGFEIGEEDWPFIKIYNERVLVQDDAMKNGRTKLWIDIFPFDNVPNYFANIYWEQIKFLRKIYYKQRYLEGFYSNIKVKKGFYRELKRCIGLKLASNIDRNKLLSYYIRVCTKYETNKTSLVQDLTWDNKPVPRYLFDDLVDYQFENITVKGFKDYDTYLTCVYGDYMKLPPEDQRVNHGIRAWRVNSDEE